QLQTVIDQPLNIPGVPFQRAHPFGEDFVGGIRSCSENSRPSENGNQGIPQFVAQYGEKLVLDPAGLLRLVSLQNDLAVQARIVDRVRASARQVLQKTAVAFAKHPFRLSGDYRDRSKSLSASRQRSRNRAADAMALERLEGFIVSAE